MIFCPSQQLWFIIFLNIMCSSSCRICLSLLFFWIVSLTQRFILDSPTVQPWKHVYPGLFTEAPKYPISVGGGKKLMISCSQPALHKISEVTASPSLAVDSWSPQTRVRINVKLFMTDNIAQKYGRNAQKGRGDRWFHPWNSLKQLWCNLFYIKEKKKKLDTAPYSPSRWLWMLSSFKVWLNVPSLYWSRVIRRYCFFSFTFFFN